MIHLSIYVESPSLAIGCLIFPGVDQLDFTGPFEVLSRIPGAAIHVIWKELVPVKDVNGLILTPQMTLEECPRLDVLHIPGGGGQQALMEDQEILSWVREQAGNAQFVLSVCTGALICGAAGLLKDRNATTHWASFDLLQYFGARPVRERVVCDGNIITAAGVTSGIDGALTLASRLCGDEIAQRIQLYMEYAPQPPFNCGSPELAPASILNSVSTDFVPLHEARLQTARRVAERLGIEV